MNTDLKETPLAAEHALLGAKMVEFGGWNMPVQYTNVIDEHLVTRTKVGLFDICHMGEFIVKGEGAKKYLQKLCVNDLDKIYPGKAQYSMLCNENGGVVDDIFIYQLGKTEFMIVTNAGTINKDHNWLLMHRTPDVDIMNVSKETAKLDLQGPLSDELLQKLCDYNLLQLKRFHFVDIEISGVKCLVSRTGYTGERGFELYFDSRFALAMWKKIMETGKHFGIKPIGLGARDTLRLEACYSLYGHELSENITPIEASLAWLVPDKEFIGSKIILSQKKQGTDRINMAFEMKDRAVAREQYPVLNNGVQIGIVSSGSYSPTFQKGIGMAFVKKEFGIGDEIEIMIRDKPYKAKIVKKPFYSYNG
ncbi:MAG: glycine cleavage system aminomethyltransferase GcvT [archaeon]